MHKIVRRPKQRKLKPGELERLVAEYLVGGGTIKRCGPGGREEPVAHLSVGVPRDVGEPDA